MSITADTRVGSCEVLTLIGVADEMYEAHDTKLGRDVTSRNVPSGSFPGRSSLRQDLTK